MAKALSRARSILMADVSRRDRYLVGDDLYGIPQPMFNGHLRAVIGIITLVSAAALTVLGVIALANPGSVLPAGTVINAGVTYYAQHVASRNFALAVFMVAALVLKDSRMLTYLLLLNAIVQALDAIFAASGGNAARVVAPLVVCVLDLGAVAVLIRTSEGHRG